MVFEIDIDKANKKIAELEAEVLILKGGMEYLETSKIPWLESELTRCRAEKCELRGKVMSEDKCPFCGADELVTYAMNTRRRFSCGTLVYLSQGDITGFDRASECYETQLTAQATELENLKAALTLKDEVVKRLKEVIKNVLIYTENPEGKSPNGWRYIDALDAMRRTQ